MVSLINNFFTRNKSTTLALGVLFLLFLASVLIRLPSANSPLIGRYAESKTYNRPLNTDVFIHTNLVFSIYSTRSIHTHLFAPYIGVDKQFITSTRDKNLTLYTSFSPALFAAPYVAISLLHFHPGIHTLQVFGLFIQLLTSVLIFYLMRQLLIGQKYSELIALLASSAYIFSTGTLLNHMNVWWAHQLLQPFLVGACLLFAKQQYTLKRHQIYLASLLLTLVAWTGAVASVGISLVHAWRYFKYKSKQDLQKTLLCLAGIVSSTALLYFQIWLASGASVTTWLSKITHRAGVRTGAGYDLPHLLIQFTQGLFVDYGAYIILAMTLLLVIKLHDIKISNVINKHRAILAISAFPVIESALLLEHDTVYTFGRLKFLLPFILLITIAGSYLVKKRIMRPSLLIALFAISAIIHAAFYLDIYRTAVAIAF